MTRCRLAGFRLRHALNVTTTVQDGAARRGQNYWLLGTALQFPSLLAFQLHNAPPAFHNACRNLKYALNLNRKKS